MKLDPVREAEEVRAAAIAVMQRYDDEMGEMRRKGDSMSDAYREMVGQARSAAYQADRMLCRAREDVVKREVFKRPAMVHRAKAGRR